jgi:hypothetical protein
MPVVFYTANLCIYDLFHILLSLWHTYGSMECMYVCMDPLKPLGKETALRRDLQYKAVLKSLHSGI